jgi:hypothetical protein
VSSSPWIARNTVSPATNADATSTAPRGRCSNSNVIKVWTGVTALPTMNGSNVNHIPFTS